MPEHHSGTIQATLESRADTSKHCFWNRTRTICLDSLRFQTSLPLDLSALQGRSVLVLTRDQLTAALALVELDGVARRMIICPPDVNPGHLAAVAANAAVDAVVVDVGQASVRLDIGLGITCSPHLVPCGPRPPAEGVITEWVLLTSGTTGAPKLVVHTLATLTAPIRGQEQDGEVVWGTFYDIRRYGGLQILLRALLGNRSFVLSSPGEAQGEYLQRLGLRHATHISGTPSHWRRALMSPSAAAIAPRYIRLSGEIADQGILNSLRAFYPHANIGHAFASTEAGVGFEVDDGLEGFPARTIESGGTVEIKIEDGSLRIRSPRVAKGYLGGASEQLTDADGFVDTGDLVERRGDRYYFLGRKTGTINIGGLKVHPEEVESVINRHPAVRMSVVRPKKNPITGSLVAADVVLGGEGETCRPDAEIRDEILQICRDRLAAHKVPATIRFVSELDLAGAGKLTRHHA